MSVIFVGEHDPNDGKREMFSGWRWVNPGEWHRTWDGGRWVDDELPFRW